MFKKLKFSISIFNVYSEIGRKIFETLVTSWLACSAKASVWSSVQKYRFKDFLEYFQARLKTVPFINFAMFFSEIIFYSYIFSFFIKRKYQKILLRISLTKHWKSIVMFWNIFFIKNAISSTNDSILKKSYIAKILTLIC